MSSDSEEKAEPGLADQVVENARQSHFTLSLGAVVDDHKWRFGVPFVLSGNVDGDLPLVVDLMRVDDESFEIVRIDRTKLFAGNSWVVNLGLF